MFWQDISAGDITRIVTKKLTLILTIKRGAEWSVGV